MTEYTPIFNRTYLKILPWFLAIAILLLTLNNQPDTVKQPEPLEIPQTYLYHDKAISNDQILLVYPFPAAFGETQQVQRRGVRLALDQSIQAIPDITINAYADHLIITLPLSSINQIPATLDNLRLQQNTHLAAMIQQASAERYLASSSIEEQALINFKLQIATQLPTFDYSRALASPQVILFTLNRSSNTTLQSLQALAEEILDNHPLSSQPSTPALPDTLIELKHRSPLHQLLIGQLETERDKRLPKELAWRYLGQQLLALTEGKSTQFRLLSEHSYPVGFSALLIRQPDSFSEPLFSNLRQYLKQSIASSPPAPLKALMVKEYEQRLSNAAQLPYLLANNLFYREETLSADQYHDKLSAITDADIISEIESLLSPQASVIIRTTPL